jgi:hypothetical protein
MVPSCNKVSISDGLVLKPTIRCVSNDFLNREQLISAQKEEPVLPCSKSFSVEEAGNASSSRGFFTAKVIAHAGKIPVFL